MASNIRSNHWLCQMTLPSMAERGGGSVIIVSSIGGLKGSAMLGAYGISKAADMQMAPGISPSSGGRCNIRANCIAPGLVRTDFARALWENPVIYEKIRAGLPLAPHRGAARRSRARPCIWPPPRGSFTTGQVIVVDGGATVAGG